LLSILKKKEIKMLEPDPTYKTAYDDVREVLDDPMCQRALYFAHKNPELVYGKDSEEFKRAQGGYFGSYFFEK
jgi:hypothetical protein